MITTPLHPHVEQLITTITSVTGHAVAFETAAADERCHRWDVIGSGGDRYGVLTVRTPDISDSHHALYAQLSRMIAHEADLRRSHGALEVRCVRLDAHAAELAALNHSLSSAAYRDSLTGLYRKWHLVEQIRLELSRATRHRRPLSLLLVEIEPGPEESRDADNVRREFASRLQSTCRTSDILAHVANDEFCALLPDTHPEGAAEVSGRLRRSLTMQPIAGATGSLEATIGTTTYVGGTSRAESPESLLEAARLRLHRARRGRTA